MGRSNFFLAAFWAITLGTAASAEQISVKHIQRPMHRLMVARSKAGKTIAIGEFTQVVQGDEVTMRLTYKFEDGSIDDETTTYKQQGTFRLVRNHHIQKGPFFVKPVDFAVDAVTGIATSRTVDKNGKIHVLGLDVYLAILICCAAGRYAGSGFYGKVDRLHKERPFLYVMVAY